MKPIHIRLIVAISVLALLSLACGRAVSTQVPPTNTAAPPTLTAIPSDTAPPPTATPVPPPTTPVPTVTPTALTATPTPTATAIPMATHEPTGSEVLWRVGGDGVFSILGGLDADGEHVYVADAYQGILVFDFQGNARGVISPGEVGYVVDVKIGPTGALYMADKAFHQVSMFTRDGELVGAFGGIGIGDGEFGPDSPRALAAGPQGEVFVLDSNLNAEGREVMRVQVFSAEGNFLRSFVIGPGYDEQAMDVGPDGTLFVVSQEGYVTEFAPDSGMLIQKLGLESLRGALPQAIGIDEAGNLNVTTQIPTAVAVLDPLGQFIEWIGGEGVRTDEGWPEGEFLFPFGVAVSPDGRYVFVGDTFESFAYVTAFERP
ncbi:MAG: NHL repeat-containing protein [Anaerolineae bacterium]|nr:NHL repeat-containing protein [Anaerolineae bacterium]